MTMDQKGFSKGTINSKRPNPPNLIFNYRNYLIFLKNLFMLDLYYYFTTMVLNSYIDSTTIGVANTTSLAYPFHNFIMEVLIP